MTQPGYPTQVLSRLLGPVSPRRAGAGLAPGRQGPVRGDRLHHARRAGSRGHRRPRARSAPDRDRLRGELRLLRRRATSGPEGGRAGDQGIGNGRGKGVLLIDDLTDTGKTAKLVREMLPDAHFATVYAKPPGAPLCDTFVTEVSQDTWIYFPWDLDLQYAQADQRRREEAGPRYLLGGAVSCITGGGGRCLGRSDELRHIVVDSRSLYVLPATSLMMGRNHGLDRQYLWQGPGARHARASRRRRLRGAASFRFLLMVEGDFARTYTHADNSKCPVHRYDEEPRQHRCARGSCARQGGFLLRRRRSPACEISADISTKDTAHEQRGTGLLDRRQTTPAQLRARQQRQAVRHVSACRETRSCKSGVSSFTFLKATQSGWDKFYKDDYTTLKETADRLCATSMEATWRWQRKPANFETANARVLDSMLEVFATTYSESVQDGLYRMATADWRPCRRSPRSIWLAQTTLYPDGSSRRSGWANKKPGVPADR